MTTEQKPPPGIPNWGVDLALNRRPGVPKEARPHRLPGAPRDLAQQVAAVPVLKRADLAALTPVFGTAQPPHGVSGAIRRFAYRIPDHRPSHWVLLIVADRVDAVESALLG